MRILLLSCLLAASLAGAAQTATKLFLRTSPVAGLMNGSLLSIQPVVEVRDASSMLVNSSTAQVKIKITSGIGGTIGGTTTVNAVNGVATFTDLTLTGIIGQVYTFEFSSSPVIVSEPFAYTSGSALTGLNGGTGWSAAWFHPNPAFIVTSIDPTGLTYTGLSTSGGRAMYASGTGGDGGRVLAAASNSANNVIWLSFLGNYTSQGGGFNSFRFMTNASSTLTGGIGGNGGYTKWSILDNTLSSSSFTTAALDGTTRLALLKIDYTAGQSSLWMDPTIASFDGTQTPSMTASFAPVFDRIDFYNRSTNVSTDEITIASTYKAAFHLEQNLTPATAVMLPLPVQWTSFTATCQGMQTLLKWSTASESNNSQFTVDRSNDDIHWVVVGTVPGAGNSHIEHNYQYLDSAFAGSSYYRLEQRDLDGNVHFSNTVVINCILGGNSEKITVFPNPATDILQFKGGQVGSLYQLIDVQGHILKSGVTQSGGTTILLSGLPAGNYFLKVRGSDSPSPLLKIQ